MRSHCVCIDAHLSKIVRPIPEMSLFQSMHHVFNFVSQYIMIHFPVHQPCRISSSRQIGCAHVLDFLLSNTNSSNGTSNMSCDPTIVAEDVKRPMVGYKSLGTSSRIIKSIDRSKRVPIKEQVPLHSQDAKGCELISSPRSIGSCSDENMSIGNGEQTSNSSASQAQQDDTAAQKSKTSQAVDLLNLAQLLRKFQ